MDCKNRNNIKNNAIVFLRMYVCLIFNACSFSEHKLRQKNYFNVEVKSI